MNFGKYAILDAVTYRFEKEPDWFWKIKPPTALEQLEVNRLVHEQRTKKGADGTTVTTPLMMLEIAVKEIALTFAGTNVPGGESLDKNKIEAFIYSMPVEMVWELWDAVGAAVPTWGPPDKTEKKIEFDETKNA